jgi:hypothetical protein
MDTDDIRTARWFWGGEEQQKFASGIKTPQMLPCITWSRDYQGFLGSGHKKHACSVSLLVKLCITRAEEFAVRYIAASRLCEIVMAIFFEMGSLVLASASIDAHSRRNGKYCILENFI